MFMRKYVPLVLTCCQTKGFSHVANILMHRLFHQPTFCLWYAGPWRRSRQSLVHRPKWSTCFVMSAASSMLITLRLSLIALFHPARFASNHARMHSSLQQPKSTVVSSAAFTHQLWSLHAHIASQPKHVQIPCRSIRNFTEEYKQKKYPIHVLLNNAAIQSPKGKRGAKTEDGFEVRPHLVPLRLQHTHQHVFSPARLCARMYVRM